VRAGAALDTTGLIDRVVPEDRVKASHATMVSEKHPVFEREITRRLQTQRLTYFDLSSPLSGIRKC
jgi:hypothetical protein